MDIEIDCILLFCIRYNAVVNGRLVPLSLHMCTIISKRQTWGHWSFTKGSSSESFNSDHQIMHLVSYLEFSLIWSSSPDFIFMALTLLKLIREVIFISWKWKSLSHAWLCGPMNCSPPGSSVHGDSPGKSTGVGCHFLLRGIFLTHGSNLGLLQCRQILYCLSHRGSPQLLVSYHIFFFFWERVPKAVIYKLALEEWGSTLAIHQDHMEVFFFEKLPFPVPSSKSQI